MLANAENGCVSAFEVYTGKEDSVEKGLGVKCLLE